MTTTSVYLGCQIDDEIAQTMQLLKGELASYQKQCLDAIEELRPEVDRILNGVEKYASATIGTTTDNKIKWTAKQPGKAGNDITITYLFLGAAVDSGNNFVFRQPSVEINGNNVTLIIGSDDQGANVAPAWINLFVWGLYPQLNEILSYELVGAGTDILEPTPAVHLTGGSSPTMKNTETAANSVAKVFGRPDYKTLLKDVDVPVIESDEDAKKYLNESDDYVVINGKLLIVDGTNMIGINKLYEVIDEDYQQLTSLMSQMQDADEQPFLVITQNVTLTTREWICNEAKEVTTVVERFRAVNRNIHDIANQYASGDLMSLNLYIFWSYEAAPTARNSKMLESWKIPDVYIGDILLGVTPESDDPATSVSDRIPIPTVYTVEDPELLEKLDFTQAEVVELIGENVDGVRIPREISIEDRGVAIAKLTRFNRRVRPNGLLSKVDTTVAASQALDMGKTLDDSGLSKELATRGKACARQESIAEKGQIPNPNIPTPDLPNIPTPDLPDASKGIEAAFGALTSVINTVNRIFDLTWNATVGMFKPLLNKIQNILSLADNVFQNSLASCLLGTGSDATGIPEPPPFGSQESPGINIPDVTGGLPIPTSLLEDALKDLAVDLDESITSAFETIMDLVRKPLCIVQSLMATLTGFKLPTLGGLLDALNPCKEGPDTEDQCPPDETQWVINDSEEMTSVMESVDRIKDLPTDAVTEEVEETVEAFTGFVDKTTTQTTNEITRGVKQVMDDIQKSLDTKLEQVEQLEQAIKSMFGDTEETALNGEENQPESAGCGSTTVGAFTDAIENFIG